MIIFLLILCTFIFFVGVKISEKNANPQGHLMTGKEVYPLKIDLKRDLKAFELH
jgi:hypothetical protein